MLSKIRFCISRRSNSTFVSKHFNVDPKELGRVISSMNTEIREGTDGKIEIKECKMCPKGNKSKPDNLWKLLVRKDGSYYCYRCSKGGSWFDLKKKAFTDSDSLDESPITSTVKDIISGADDDCSSANSSLLTSVSSSNSKSSALPDQEISRGFSRRLFPYLGELDSAIESDEDVRKTRDYLLSVRGLDKDIIMRYGVGVSSQKFPSDNRDENGNFVWEDKICVTFPWIREETTDECRRRIQDSSCCSDKSTAQDESASDCGCGGSSTPCKPPTVSRRNVIERLKYRALETKGLQRLLPKNGSWGFFGWHLVKPKHKEIIITEGEYDAMAVAQALKKLPPEHRLHDIPVVSLPNGCSSLPVELLPRLERFQTIFLWLDNDKPGMDGAEKMARKLGLKRCLIVRPDPSMQNPPKDANDALRQNIPGLIPKLLESSKLLNHDRLLKFSDIRDQVLRQLRSGVEWEGTQSMSFPRLTSICKGFRKGELVIFTGPTGSGKTTFLSQLSLDFAKQGAPTLWGSFEIQNHRLVSKMLHQYFGANASSMLLSNQAEDLLQDFESLPLSFMNFHGGSDINEILEVMDIAVYRDDISHIIVDNLQFMMPRRHTGRSSLDRFEAQDMVLDKFRKFASEKNVNVIVVIHPRKIEDNTPLGMASISGTAKATQEADLVLLLQRINGRHFLEVKKNRFDGELGSMGLRFSRLDARYHETMETMEAEYMASSALGNPTNHGQLQSNNYNGSNHSQFLNNRSKFIKPKTVPPTVNDVDLPL